MPSNPLTRPVLVAQVEANITLLSSGDQYADVRTRLKVYQDFLAMLNAGDTRDQMLVMIHDKIAEISILPGHLIDTKKWAWEEVLELVESLAP